MTSIANNLTSSTQRFLYVCAFSAAVSAIAYELLLASYATFLLGATIFQYSLVLSLMMASMGAGALFTQTFAKKAAVTFWVVETALAWVALLAIPTLYFVFAKQWFTGTVVLSFVIAIGLGIGMEIPLLNELTPKRESLPQILFFDYLGGFLGGMLFPLVLLPRLGFFRVSALLAVANAILALYFLQTFSRHFPRKKLVTAISLLTLAATLTYLFGAENLRRSMEHHFFGIQ